MDYEKEIIIKIGRPNLTSLRDAIRDGQLEDDKIRDIARKMGGRMFGTYKEKKRHNESSLNVFNYMMDTYYNTVLCKSEGDGYQSLVDILRDESVDLTSLALTLKPLTKGDLNIGLPTSHYVIPDLDEQSKTGSLAHPSNQGQTLTCASHSVGKAILEILDSVGWNGNQDEIIKTLIAIGQPDGLAQNPDIFNNEILKVKVFSKEDPGMNGDVRLEIRIQNRWGKKLAPHAFRTVPVSVELDANKIKMVLRWDMYDNTEKCYKLHAVYAKEYNPVLEKYSCINSWGDDQDKPQISKSDVESIYYVTIKQVFPNL